MADLFGSPGTTNVIQAPGTPAVKPPGYRFASWLASQLPGLMNTPFPTYQGQLDPGLSPTMQDAIRRAQGYGQSSPPEILAGVQGVLGRFMNPTYRNPWHALFNANGGAGSPATGTGGGGLATMQGGPGGAGTMGGAAGGMGMGGPGAGGTSPWGVGNRPETFGGAPNYFQVDPNQRVYGGRSAGSYGWNMAAPPVGHGPLPPSSGQPAGQSPMLMNQPSPSDLNAFTTMFAGG